jgi:acetolactate synthase-1/2/3 large subunit
VGGLKGAEIIVEYLTREKVPYAVGLCGHGDLGLLDALHDRREDIATLSVHHESVAGFIADAYYRVRHQPLATFTSCGPGSANLPVALASALMDDSALLAITGNVATSQFNRAPFQETGRFYQADFPSVIRPYVKRSFQATRPEQLPLMLRQAFATMLAGRPGPVHLDVPLNVFVERSTEPVPDPGCWRGGVSGRAAAHPDEVARALTLLLAAERPVIIVGHGAENADAHDAVLALAAEAGMPVVSSPLGKSVLDNRHPSFLGPTGRNGTYPANRATRTADVLLALGTRFDDRATSSWLPGYTYAFDEHTALIHVHIDPAELGRNFPPSVGIAADPRTVTEQLLTALLQARAEGDDRARPDTSSRRAWLDHIQSWRHTWDADTMPQQSESSVPLRPERVLAELRAALPDQGILLSDVGVHHNWIVQNWEVRAPRTLLQSWGFASMGFGVAGALGARLAAPDTPVVAVVGDGGFLMFPNVVASAVEYDLPAVWLVWNNGGYMSIRDQQHSYFGQHRELATAFRHEPSGRPYSSDFAAMARSMGGVGMTVTKPGEVAEAVHAALASGRPTVLDVQVDSDITPPAVATWDLPPLPHPEPRYRWPDP